MACAISVRDHRDSFRARRSAAGRTPCGIGRPRRAGASPTAPAPRPRSRRAASCRTAAPSAPGAMRRFSSSARVRVEAARSTARPLVGVDHPSVGPQPGVVVGLTKDRRERTEVGVREAREVGRRHDHRGVLEPVVVVDRASDIEQRGGVAEHLGDRPRALGIQCLVQAGGERGAPVCQRSGVHVANRAASVATEMVRTHRGVGMTRRPRHPVPAPSRSPRLDTTSLRAPTWCITPCTTNAAAHDRVGAVRVEPRHLRAPLHRPAGQIFDQVVEAPLLQEVAVQQRQRVVGALQVHLREVADGAADPDEVLLGLELRDPCVVERRCGEPAERIAARSPSADRTPGSGRSRAASRAASTTSVRASVPGSASARRCRRRRPS